jgi:hypothetical protein
MKESSEGGNPSMIYLIHGRNLWTCYNVPPPSTAMTKKKKVVLSFLFTSFQFEQFSGSAHQLMTCHFCYLFYFGFGCLFVKCLYFTFTFKTFFARLQFCLESFSLSIYQRSDSHLWPCLCLL